MRFSAGTRVKRGPRVTPVLEAGETGYAGAGQRPAKERVAR